MSRRDISREDGFFLVDLPWSDIENSYVLSCTIDEAFPGGDQVQKAAQILEKAGFTQGGDFFVDNVLDAEHQIDPSKTQIIINSYDLTEYVKSWHFTAVAARAREAAKETRPQALEDLRALPWQKSESGALKLVFNESLKFNVDYVLALLTKAGYLEKHHFFRSTLDTFTSDSWDPQPVPFIKVKNLNIADEIKPDARPDF